MWHGSQSRSAKVDKYSQIQINKHCSDPKQEPDSQQSHEEIPQLCILSLSDSKSVILG